MDTTLHKKYCGTGNELILKNLSLLCETNKAVEIRVPLIQGINDSVGNIEKTAAFLYGKQNITKVVLLRYHKLGLMKQTGTSNYNPLKDVYPPTLEKTESIVSVFKNTLRGIPVIIR
jgi:pyruvate formate lyase activating enzyme